MIAIDCARSAPPRNSAFQAACMNAASSTRMMAKGESTYVVPAEAGTQNPWRLHSLRRACRNRSRLITKAGGYGSPEFTEQVQHLLGCCGDGTMLWPAQP